MKLHLLGINGPFPESRGATSGYLLEAGDMLFQFDLGTGTLARLQALTPPEGLTALFLSHWHYDHTSDLLPLIYLLESRGRTLPVYAPADQASPLRNIVANASCFSLRDIASGDVLSFGDAEVRVCPARHPVPGVGFTVRRGGKCFGYTGDTNTVPGLQEHYRGCDLLLADGLFPSASWGEGKPHLSAALAADLALKADVGQLIVTHLNPSFPPSVLLEEARAVFPRVSLAEAGARIGL